MYDDQDDWGVDESDPDDPRLYACWRLDEDGAEALTPTDRNPSLLTR